jgi:hypothetical protein
LATDGACSVGRLGMRGVGTKSAEFDPPDLPTGTGIWAIFGSMPCPSNGVGRGSMRTRRASRPRDSSRQATEHSNSATSGLVQIQGSLTSERRCQTDEVEYCVQQFAGRGVVRRHHGTRNMAAGKAVNAGGRSVHLLRHPGRTELGRANASGVAMRIRSDSKGGGWK